MLVGGYYVLNKLTGFNPLGESWNGFLTWLSHPFQTQTGTFALSSDSGRAGDVVVLLAAGLKPNGEVTYGWKPNFTTGFQGYSDLTFADAAGNLRYPFYIAATTPQGNYTIYLDQRSAGGGYGERGFKVLA